MRSAEAYAKINLGLVVGPVRADGKHEVVTVLQRIGVSDTIELEAVAPELGIVVDGFEDTVVRAALSAFNAAAGLKHGWHVRIEKRIPVAAGLGGGSSDAAAALRLANEISGAPLHPPELHVIAATIGADVPFFLHDGARLATGEGSELAPVQLGPDVAVVLLLPDGRGKDSTAEVYRRFDDRAGAADFEGRRVAMLAAVERATTTAGLAALPRNDLGSSPLPSELERLGAFRADVTGAGPAVYGLFESEDAAERAARELAPKGRTWLTHTIAGR